MIKNNKYEVLTDSGFKDFDGIKKTKRKNNIKITFNDLSDIIVTPEHRILVGSSKTGKIFRRANKLKLHQKVQNKYIIYIEYDVECSNNFYDLINVKDGNHYITSGITSHNCAYIKKTLWDEFIDSVIPTMNSLTFKQVIMTSTANGMNHFEKIVNQAKRKDTSEKLVTCDWREVPHYDKKGKLLDPDEYKKNTIRSYGKQYFAQTEECVGGDTIINTLEYNDITIKELYEKEGIYLDCSKVKSEVKDA